MNAQQRAQLRDAETKMIQREDAARARLDALRASMQAQLEQQQKQFEQELAIRDKEAAELRATIQVGLKMLEPMQERHRFGAVQ
jgi:hypothetical protein